MQRYYGQFQALFVLACLAFTPAYADVKDDAHIQSTSDAVKLEIDGRTFAAIKGLFEEGYPPATVMLHAISIGVSIDDVVYLAVRADPSRAQEFYNTAMAMLSSLPGWVCRESPESERYPPGYKYIELGDKKTVDEVARRFFDENKYLVPFPDWTEGKRHMDVSLTELAGLIKKQNWYTRGTADPTSRVSAPNRPVFVSFYKDTKEVVTDATQDQLRAAQQAGKTTLPVVFIYNESHYRSIGSFPPDLTTSQIVDQYVQQRIRVTPVPEWHVGDYHKMEKVSELKKLLEIPKKSDMPPALWTTLENDVKQNGFPIPVLLSIFDMGRGRVWGNQLQRLAVAESVGVQEVPVVYMFYTLDRGACGRAGTDCSDRICNAAVAAGASAGICRASGSGGAATAK